MVSMTIKRDQAEMIANSGMVNDVYWIDGGTSSGSVRLQLTPFHAQTA